MIVRATGDPEAVVAVDQVLHANASHWAIREITGLIRRTLKRMDLTSRSFFALIEPGNAFAGTLFELVLAADRAYMIDHPDEPNSIRLSVMNGGAYPMSNGLTRLQVRFLGEPESVGKALEHDGPLDAQEALAAGLVFSAPDDIDWDDEVRMAIEARAAFSPDALTGMEANLRFAGPETMETKIFGRLTAWQNWIFQRPNAVGEKGALMTYGREGRPTFDFKRTSDVERRTSGDRMISAEKIPEQRRPGRQQAAAARARTLAARLSRLVARHGAAGIPGQPPGLPAHRDQRRRRRLGALRLRQAARVSLGHLPRRADAGSPHRLRRLQGPAGVAGSAGRVPQPAAPPDRHPGRHRARQRRAAALARRALPEPLRPAQPVPGQRRGRPPPVGDGLPAALVLRPRRPRRGRGAARAPQRQRRHAAHARSVQRADRHLARLLRVHDVHRSRRQVAAAVAVGELARSAGAHDQVHAHRRSASHVRRRERHRAHPRAHLPAAARNRLLRRRPQGRRHRPAADSEVRQLLVQPEPRPARQRGVEQRRRLLLERPQGPRRRGQVRRRPHPGGATCTCST